MTYFHDGTGLHPFGTAECDRCGAVSAPLHVPIEIDDLCDRLRAFEAEHVACPNYLVGRDPGDENDHYRSRSRTAKPGASFRLTFSNTDA